jgi:cytoskeletal protein CcmA (bactofilin family)
MFSKTTNTGGPGRPALPAQPISSPNIDPARSAPPPPQRQAPRVASILGADLVFEGSITGDGELLVDGAVKGDIHVARLVIGEHAHVEGTVRGVSVEVRGHVTGNVEGKSIHLLQSAHVEGDITHEQLSIDVGAFFQGRCSQFRPQSVAVAQPYAMAQPGPATGPVAEVIPLDAHHGS